MDFWEVSLGGWLGAVFGSLASIGVAVFVLRRTLRHEREQSAEQREAERRLGVWQHQLELFGEVTARAMTLSLIPTDRDRLIAVTDDFTSAVHRWRMYTDDSHGSFPHDVEILALHLVRGAWRAQEEERADARLTARTPRERVYVEALSGFAAELTSSGRVWHQDSAKRSAVEDWARQAVAEARALWPRRVTA
ncbi:hypothetical protein FA014_02010 [Cellulomonas hominis]|uniref:DUF4760 domain-containing protein n=1 Tax=Cellulomonas hominis TaxID=156981 RepID=A0A7Z8K1Q7_9CELL|nr:hypothetical protein [Cellulomonas hominis]TKR27155.1 hypothetical protein FA014_02010 [Cellulomonas hominis]